MKALLGRRQFALSGLVMLAACAAPTKRPVFKKYAGPPVTEVRVFKGQRYLQLLNGDTVLKSYEVGLGNEPIGHKQFEGDGKTPEGLYYLDRFNPRSSYHLSVGISYPDKRDKAHAAASNQDAGGDIMIHGRGPDGNRLAPQNRDWTAGCIAVTDNEIEEIYAMLQPNTPIRIYP